MSSRHSTAVGARAARAEVNRSQSRVEVGPSTQPTEGTHITMKFRIRLLSSVAVAGLATAALAFTAAAAMAPSAKLSVEVNGSTAVATVTLSHFTIDAMDVGKARMAGKGHLHFALDGGKFDYPKYSGAN